jgi:paraquat-inducible protein A
LLGTDLDHLNHNPETKKISSLMHLYHDGRIFNESDVWWPTAAINNANGPNSVIEILACHECDMLFQRDKIPAGARANCTRCGAELYRQINNSLDRSLALYLSTLVCMVIANFYPFIVMQTAGITVTSLVSTGGLALYQFGMGELGFVVFFTSILAPLICVIGVIYLLISVRFGALPPHYGVVYRLIKAFEPWCLLAVFMLGTLIAVVKLQSAAQVTPGLGMLGFVMMLITYTAARASFDPEVLWAKCDIKQQNRSDFPDGLEQARVLSCHTCGLVRPLESHMRHCLRCGAAVHFRVVNSLQKTWALLISACIMLIPANIYPVMSVSNLGRGSADTIVSGVIHLMEAGLIGLAILVLFASIVVPLVKLTALGYLLHSVRNRSNWRPRDRALLYRITKIVGAWSMVDVFLVGLLSGLVNFGFLASIEPEIGVTFFGTAVILTMLAAHSFDPRLIWDNTLLDPNGMPVNNLPNNKNDIPATLKRRLET